MAVMKLYRDEKEGLSRRSPLKPPSFPPAWQRGNIPPSSPSPSPFARPCQSYCSSTRGVLALNARLWYSSCVLRSRRPTTGSAFRPLVRLPLSWRRIGNPLARSGERHVCRSFGYNRLAVRYSSKSSRGVNASKVG